MLRPKGLLGYIYTPDHTLSMGWVVYSDRKVLFETQMSRHMAVQRTGHLGLHQHGHIHKHVVQLLDAGFQTDDVLVPRLDLIQGLPGDLGVGDDLGGRLKAPSYVTLF